ncbi:MAG TPA: T9SS type A sorting domain-containing protein [Chitinophagaceae bacterium]|nr:T9SS type A sorting domain-containing protein [Chitinophagaceae bacterium]
MKHVVPATLLFCLMALANTAQSQNTYPREKFPTTFSGNSTTSEDLGSWTASKTGNSIVQVSTSQYYSSPSSLSMGITDDADMTHTSTVTSPVIDLSAISCSNTNRDVIVKFKIYFSEINNSSEFGLTVNASKNASPSWSSVYNKTGTQLRSLYAAGTWYDVTINLGNQYRTANFRLQFVSNKTGTGNENNVIWIDDVIVLDPMIPDFSATPTYTDNGTAGISAGDVYKYANVASYPEAIYAEVKIESMVNATLDNIDNNSADVGVAQRFQPRIAPSPQTMSTTQEGYIQFVITFKSVATNSVVNMTNLRYRHFDIDGNTGTGFTFRETSWITGSNSILVNNPSDLDDGGTISSGGYSWRKALGETSEHDGITTDNDVYYTATFNSAYEIRIRLGYLFTSTGGSTTIGAREYASEFGCFTISNSVPLPITLINFSGSLHNKTVSLNWETENQVNFDHFEIERSSDGKNYTTIGTRAAQTAGNGSLYYLFNDDLTTASGTAFYYRLKMVDADGSFKYSSVILIRRDQAAITGIMMNPNPVVSGMATARFSSSVAGIAEFRVTDMSGKMILQQQNKIYEGTNSVTINNIDRLQPGLYLLQMTNGEERSVIKFSVGR